VRILQVHTSYREAGGEDSVVQAERRLLRAAGHQVDGFHRQNPGTALMSAAGLAAAPANPVAAAAVARAARAARPDVAHVHNTWFAMSPAVVAALHSLRIPLVVTLHNYRIMCANSLLFRAGQVCEDCVEGGPWPGVRHRCYRDSLASSAVAAATIGLHRRARTWARAVDRFIVPSSFAVSRFAAWGLPADRLVVRPHFTADPGPRPESPARSADVLIVGRLSPEKGIDVAIRAWAAAPPRGLRLVVVGDGPLRAQLQGAAPNVVFTGPLSRIDVAERMKAARALLFPSVAYEAQGMSVLEAMAAGVPVVASDLGGTPEMLGPSSGWLATAGDERAWQAALARLVDDEEIETAGRAARSRYEEAYTPAIGLASLLGVYGQALGDRSLASVDRPGAGDDQRADH
jgi:glycosyltransferase involved in cell wall biosynthesis